MWDFYAPEPRMRLNLGIRRRLVPLLENDRERIEVANAILLTFIGSPVLYYGDEIGMGDNIWLDDRDGVRTPMQWNSGSNAGFSDAPADRLYAPVIDDPAYGYQKVNVDAQKEDPGSLLNRMRTLIHVRRRHPAFGRGTLQLLTPEPESVLAYLRVTTEETLLVLANLSAEPQRVTLDLSHYAGMTPVDLLTRTALPEITVNPYCVTLSRYEYRWLKLQGIVLSR